MPTTIYQASGGAALPVVGALSKLPKLDYIFKVRHCPHVATATATMQSELSSCNLEAQAEEPQDVRYRQEIESHNLFDSVLESPTKNCRRKSLQDTPLDEILVSVNSWSDEKGHTEYVISTSVIGTAFVTTSRRFSDFITLHSRICTPLGLVPQFPVPKTLFVTDGVKISRMRAMQGYLRHACATADKRAGPPSDGVPGAKLPLALSEFLGFEVGAHAHPGTPHFPLLLRPASLSHRARCSPK